MALNKVFLIGNAGRDPEVHYFDSNTRKATITLATTDRGYTKQDGTVVQDRTEWHNVVFWRGLAEVVEKYVRKGSKIFVEGKITTRSYEDKTGVKRYVTEIVADNLELLGSRPAADETSAQNIPPSNNTYNMAYNAPVAEPVEPDEADGDLPF